MNKDLLRPIADNPALFDALKALFKERFNEDDITANMSNETIGQVARARYLALKGIDEVFEKIRAIKTASAAPEHKPNQAR